jgi:CRP/FNR family transcriptional regulator
MLNGNEKRYFEDIDITKYFDDYSKELIGISSRILALDKNQMMQRENGECQGVPYVMSGELKLYRSLVNGRKITIYRVKAGEMCVLAALSVLTDKLYDFSVLAEEDTKLLVINSSVFKELIDRNRSFNQFLLTQLADKFIHTMILHEKIHLKGVDDKLLDYLYENQVDSVVSLTHARIADDLGTSRVVISRAMGHLREKGIIVSSRNKTIINK